MRQTTKVVMDAIQSHQNCPGFSSQWAEGHIRCRRRSATAIFDRTLLKKDFEGGLQAILIQDECRTRKKSASMFLLLRGAAMPRTFLTASTQRRPPR